MRKRYRIPAFALVALLAAAPLATCLVAVQAHAATAMAPGDDCDAPRPGEAPALCGPQMVVTSAPAGVVVASAALRSAAADASGRTPGLTVRAPHPVRDAGSPGARPPAWLRHSAFLI